MRKIFHLPALLNEVVGFLNIKKSGKYIDATVGGGGDAQAILKLEGEVLGIDCDPEAIKSAGEYLSFACPPRSVYMNVANTSWRLVRGNFKDLRKIALANDFGKVDGILFDLGISSHQLETPERGFSFNLAGPLDMRMDPDLEVTAADLVNGLNKGELKELFSKLGQEHHAGRIAEAICRARGKAPIKTCNQLAEIIIKTWPKKGKFARIHPATRVFQALRIAVNDELNNLRQTLPQAVEILNPGGRLVVISFHSGEDRIVKQFLKDRQKDGEVQILTKKPVRPTKQEIEQNPRSRSAKLRAAEKR